MRKWRAYWQAKTQHITRSSLVDQSSSQIRRFAPAIGPPCNLMACCGRRRRSLLVLVLVGISNILTCGSGPLLCMACPSSCTFPRQVFEKFQNWGHTTQKRGISHASRPRRKIARPARSGLEIAATKTRNIHTTPSPALPRQPPTLKTGPPGPSKGTQGRK